MRLILFLMWALPSFAQTQIERELQSWLTQPDNISASISFEIQKIDSSEPASIASFNATTSLIPASTTKLFSTSIALETLGPDFYPETQFYIDGRLDSNHVLNGNLYVRCLGDPSLGSRFFSDKAASEQFLKNWCDSIQKRGITEINGSIIVDGSAFGYNGVPNGWNWSDIGNYYGAGPSATVIADNTSYLHFKTGSVGTMAQLMYTVPEEDYLSFVSQIEAKSISNDQSLIYGAPFSTQRFGTGALPANRNDFTVKASLSNPEATLVKQLFETMTTQNIRVGGYKIAHNNYLQGEAPIGYDDKILLFTYRTESVQSIVNKTNEKSVNLFAEQLLALTSMHANGSAQNLEDNAEWANKYWKQRLKGFNARITDGSGLSRTNAISASDFCALLQYMHPSKNADAFINSLPITGKHGTLKSYNRGSAAAGRIHAKTGTMNGVKSYAGYVLTLSGETLCFALIINNSNWSSYEMKANVERLFNQLIQL